MPTELSRLGALVRDLRDEQDLTQEEVAGRCPGVTRNHVAHLEQGLRLPTPEALAAICRLLGVPSRRWEPLLEPRTRRRLELESALAELAGVPVSVEALDASSAGVAEAAAAKLFDTPLTHEQAFDAFSSLLVFYGVRTPSRPFFDRYFGDSAFTTPERFVEAVHRYQREAIRLFPTFSDAYEFLNAPGALDTHLVPLAPRSDAAYRARTPWTVIEPIEESRLADLGYISAQRVHQEHAERESVADFLRALATDVRARGRTAIASIAESKSRRMDSLLRRFGSKLAHGTISPLFAPDADELEREADRLSPRGEGDLETIAATEKRAEANLARYLAADAMDVYVATSMRTDADFISVNTYVNRLFAHPLVAPLHLRFFNPTQSWIEDRVAKGLVEALMLRRAQLTIYMAQKDDTFGKDSEASVALGQGKPVIVYVPRLYEPAADVDSDTIIAMSRDALLGALAREGGDEASDADGSIDTEALAGRLLNIRMKRLDRAGLCRVVRTHWADFDLYSEASRIDDAEGHRGRYRAWLDRVIRRGEDVDAPPGLASEVIGILVAVALRFERRAHIFREVHPLALQVILSSGVLNGILVVRSVDGCANIVGALLRNELELELRIDDRNYRLVEKTTGSTIRVISRHRLLANAFSRFYR